MAILAVAALLARFLRHDLCPFIADEPTLLFAAREEPFDRTWLSISPLMGSQGVHYGPMFFLLERLIVNVFGPRPEAVICVVCALLTAAHAALARAIARAFCGGWWMFGLVAGLLAASPCQFFWSRSAWDNPVANACVAVAVVLVAPKQPPRFGRCLALGLVLGVAVGTHLMVVSFVACLLALLAWEGRREPVRTLGKLALTTVAMLAVNAGYLLYLARQPALVPSASQPFSWSLAFDFLQDAAGITTATRTSYFFDNDWAKFLAWLGPAAEVLPGRTVALLLSALALTGLLLTIRHAEGAQKRLALLALSTWFVHAAFCALRHLEPHPHYQQPSYWVIPLGLAALLARARRSTVWSRASLNTGLVLFIAVQLGFIARWMSYVDERGGTQGTHYSVPLAIQRDAVRRACATAASTVVFDNRTQLVPISIQYLASIEPDCHGKQVAFCVRRCPRASSERTIFRLEYAGPGGRLR